MYDSITNLDNALWNEKGDFIIATCFYPEINRELIMEESKSAGTITDQPITGMYVYSTSIC